VGRELVDARFDRSGRHVLAVSTLGGVLADSRSGDVVDPRNCLARIGFSCLQFGLVNLDGVWKHVYSKAGLISAIVNPRIMTRTELAKTASWAPSAVDLSPSGRVVAVGAKNGVLALLDVRTGALLAPLTQLGTALGSVRFSPDGRHLLAAGEQAVWLLDATTLERGPVLRQTASVMAAEFADGGATVVTAGDDGRVRRWDTRDGRPAGSRRFRDGLLLGVAGGPNGVVAVADGDTLTVQSGREQATILRGGLRSPSTVAVSADGEFVAGAGSGPAIVVWERRTGRVAASFALDEGEPKALAFSRDGHRLVAAGTEGVARVFDCEICSAPGALLRLAQQRVSAQLSPRERDAIVRSVTDTSPKPG
jgi:WD40 repeat protein